MKRDVPPTDAVFGANKRQAVDEPTQVIAAEDGGPVKRQPVAPARGGANQAPPAHTTIIGFENPPAGRGQAAGTEPVVAWLVVLSGPGKGQHRPVFNGSNTIGRNATQRIPLDFGDASISGEQQAFLVYDGRKRQYQLVPNLGRPNLVHLNGDALLSNAELKTRDRITMGQTTLMFMPLCDKDFDWSTMKVEMKK